MNKVILVGRLTREPETRYTAGENATAITRFSVAVNRKFKNAEGNYDADFPNCVAFGKTGEFVQKFFHKGDMIGLDGRITTGSYTNKDGVKVYTTEVTVENAEFTGSKNANVDQGSHQEFNRPAVDDFMNVPDSETGELPF